MPATTSTVMSEQITLGHVMVDIETMGNSSNSAIVSIGAVEFDIKSGQTGKMFYTTIDLQSSIDAGLTVTGSTIKWWLQQNKAAQDEIINAKDNLKHALLDFHSWLNHLNSKELLIWANSPRFDLGILEDAFNKFNIERPWNFRNERDVRTLVKLCSEDIKDSIPINEVLHHSLNDCLYQIKLVSKAYNEIL